MPQPLQRADIEFLCHRYSVPQMISEWIASDLLPSDEALFTFHDQLSTLSPEDAMVCIALCVHALHLKKPLADLQILSEQIIEGYGLDALHRLRDTDKEQDTYSGNIEIIAHDLTNLSRQLDRVCDAQEDHSSALSACLSALGVQAGAQAEIARYVLLSFKKQEHRETPYAPDDVPFLKTPPVNDNDYMV